MQVALIIVVIVVAAGVGAYALSTQGSQGSNANEISISITETDPVNQIDNFVPQNVTIKEGASIAFAVQNGDDEDRVFTITAFNFNITIPAHTTSRGTFTPDKTGTFTMFSPQTKPSAVSQGKPGSACTGYVTVTP
jgi:heme/copper-type cytochrome/quinol oxidase subunit 2